MPVATRLITSFATSLVATLSVAAAQMPSAAIAGPDLRFAALTGHPAPGTPPGTLFTTFGPAMFDGAPTISVDSSIAFACILSDGTTGFWVDHGSGPELLAHSGTHAPGTEPAVLFSQRLAEVVLVTPPLLVPGHAVLRNTVTGPGVGLANDEGIWHADGSGLTLVMREGTPAPGLANVNLSTLGLRAVDNAGRAIVSSSLVGAVVVDNDESIWRALPDASLELLAREGSTAPGTGLGVVFATAAARPSTFPFVLANAAGNLLFEGGLHGPGTNTSNDEALFLRDASGTQLFLREGDPVPGMPGHVFSGGNSSFHSFRISLANDNHVAITASVASSMGTASALLADTSGALAPLVRSGDPAPGTGGHFDILGRPSLNGRGEVAFLASTSPGAAFPTLGLWMSSASGLRALALPGQQLPGQPVATAFQNIRSINGFDDAGFVLFTADLGLAGGGFGSTALLLADPVGVITILARTGGQLAVAEGDLRTVAQVMVRGSALSGDAHATFAVRFTDGSAAEVVAGLRVEHVSPGAPGKGGLVPALNVATGVGISGLIEVTNGTGGVHGVIGLAPPDDPLQPQRFATFPLGCGLALSATNLLLIQSSLSGTAGAAGQGSFALPLGPLPPGLIGTTWYLQAAYVDLEAPCGVISLTDMVRVTVR